MFIKRSHTGLAEKRHNQIEALKDALERKHSATNFLSRAMGSIAVKFRETSVKVSERQTEPLPPTPLWNGPVHFHMRSVEATLALPTDAPISSQQIVDIVIGDNSDNAV